MSLIRLSHSALERLHTCERLFQLERLLVSDSAKQDYPTTIFGKAWGAAVASYLLDQDQTKALWILYSAYTPLLEDEKRTVESCAFLFQRAVPELDKILQDWEVCIFKGKPAVELSFRLNIDQTYYFVGYIDVVLKNRWTPRYAIMDAKTTALQLYDLSPVFQNSGQCLGYSIVLDQIVGENQADYDVLYFVGQIGRNPFAGSACKLLTFAKTLHDRLHWFITLGLDVQHLERMAQLKIYPQRGGNCLQYNRPCRHFGTCNLHSLDREKPYEEDLIEYDFVYDLNEVIADHLRRI